MDPRVRLVPGDPGAAKQRKQLAFRGRAGASRAVGQIEEFAKPSYTSLARISGDLIPKLGVAGQAAIVGFSDDRFERVLLERTGELQDRPRRAGEGEAVAPADVAGAISARWTWRFRRWTRVAGGTVM